MTSVGGIGFELSFDGSKMMSSINSACERIHRRFSQSFEAAGQSATQSISTSNSEIQAILDDSGRSMRSKASAIAAIYRREGDAMSDAMRKAWSHIERDSAQSSDKTEKSFISIRRRAKDSADQMAESFSRGFSEMESDAANTEKSISSKFSGLIKKAGTLFAGLFAAKKLIDFGKQCIELGSDLSEVQNVVDVTFSTMSSKVDEFAKSAVKSFGLSETMAKQYTGTFGAMAKAVGFSERRAYNMSTALTGLAGDVASFYNLNQDEAYTKLKSVFTGETESLKDLGVVMTQTALDSYAMANGFGKTTSAMTEQEKVALRYQFVMDQLSLAQGDFARTSDSWANQSRLMALQAQSIMATIGQGLINLFTPVLKIINVVLGKIAQLAEAFKGFTELITGKKSESGSGITSDLTSDLADATAAAGSTGDGLANAADQAGNLADNAGAAGNAAKKAAKEMRSLMGFDEVNKVADQTGNDSGSGGSGSPESGGSGSGLAAGLGSGATNFGKLADTEDNALNKVNKTLDKIIKKVKELAKLCKKGFFDGLGDLSVLDSIKDECESIQKSFIEIFTDQRVIQSADQLSKTVAYNLGKIAGSVASTGLSIADNLLGGISKYLEKNTSRISQYIADMFDLAAIRVTLAGDVADLIAQVSSVLRSDAAKQITADLIEIFANGFMGVSKLLYQFKTDLATLIVKPLTDNAENIKSTLNGLLEPIQTITGTIAATVTSAFEEADAMYQAHIAPMFAAITQGLTELVASVCMAIDTYIKPALDGFAAGFAAVWASNIQPAISQAIILVGQIADCISVLWQEWLQPFIQWFIDTFGPVIGELLALAGESFNNFVGSAGNLIETLLGALSSFINFLTDVFKGDWESAWEDMKTFFVTLWDGISTYLSETWDNITTTISGAWQIIVDLFTPVAKWFSNIFDSASKGIQKAWSGVVKFFDGIWSGIQTAFSDTKKWLGDTFQSAWDGIVNIWNGAQKWFSDNVTQPIDTLFTNLWEGIKTFAQNTWNDIVGIFKAGGTIFDGFATSVKDVFVTLVNGIIRGINNVIKIPFDNLNSVLGGIRGIDILGAKPFGWVPSISVPQIPQLAQGGYVKANTPQLAMIGDNRHQGEVVAPEDKLLEMARKAASGAGSPEQLQKIISLLETLISLVQGGDDIVLAVDGEELARAMITGSLRLKRRHSTVTVTV